MRHRVFRRRDRGTRSMELRPAAAAVHAVPGGSRGAGAGPRRAPADGREGGFAPVFGPEVRL